MTVEGCSGEFLTKLLDESTKGFSLLGCAGVLRFAVRGKSADIADADTDGVLTCAVSSNLVLCTTDMDGAITIDDEVVTYLAESSGTMPTVDVGYCVVLTFLGGTTVDDDLGYLSHRLKVPKFQEFQWFQR